jgi:tetratricopeptide (TPR) repeat protein
LKQDLAAQAFCLVRLGRLEEAAAVYVKMLRSWNDDAELWRFYAWILNRLSRYEEALVSCGKSIELDPDEAKSWCFQASVLLNLARPTEALRSCERAIKLNASDSLAWTTRGAALADLDLFEEAMEAFTEAVRLEPQSAKARIHLCAALIELGRFDQALEQAQKATETNPEDPNGWVVKGSVLNGMRRYEDSLQSFQKAILLGEDSAFVHFKAVELLFALDRWREGAAHLDKALTRFAHSENPNTGDSRALIQHLLPSLNAPKTLQLSIKVLLLIHRKHNMLGALGQGLIQCIPDIASSPAISDADASQWLDSWRLMADAFPEFRLPVRLLDSAVRYRKTRDVATLMDLPQEERKLLEPLVGVHVEAIA